jgi:hypothetical protein
MIFRPHRSTAFCINAARVFNHGKSVAAFGRCVLCVSAVNHRQDKPSGGMAGVL